MAFASLYFSIFILAVYAVFRLTPQRAKWIVLLVGSYAFYASLKAPYLLLALGFTTTVTYLSGLALHRAAATRTKKAWLWVGIGANLSVLALLKYVSFVNENIIRFFGATSWSGTFLEQGLVCVGVSYYVFQAVSYLVDIYLEMDEPERHFGYFALYMSFFPKLLQGPIERASHLLPQLRQPFSFSTRNAVDGAHLFLWGLFKKAVIADRLAITVDAAYQNVHQHSGLTLMVATYCYAFQIFFDFSGYTDMALGVARFFNIRLTQNFNRPYLATSVSEFWRRWHISFSSWILDYIFKPLQFEFRDWKRWGTPLALMITFLVSGIWHGASWGFVAWGGIHGFYLGFSSLTGKATRKFRKKLGLETGMWVKGMDIAVTFHLVCIAWIFFRAQDLSDAVFVVFKLLLELPFDIVSVLSSTTTAVGLINLGQPSAEFALTACLTAVAILLDSVQRYGGENSERKDEVSWLTEVPCLARVSIYGVIIYLAIFYGTGTQTFIYAQF